MRKLPFLMLLGAALFATPAGASDLAAVKAEVEGGKATLVDVREQDEWDEGHLTAARLVPLSSVKDDAARAAARLPKDRPVYLHCGAGPRAKKAAELLKKEGVDARALMVKYKALVGAGFAESR